MRNIILVLFIILVSRVFSQVPPKPKTNSFVYDYAETYTDSQRVALQKMLYEFEMSTQIQIVVINAEDLNGLTIEDYSIQIAEKWGIGNNDDKGILICNYIPQRKTRIEVGYGLEGVVTDFWSSKHIREDAAPYFKEGYQFRGMYELMLSLMNKIEPNYQPSLMSDNLINQVKELFENRIPEKPSPFLHVINATNYNISDSLDILEAYLSKIQKDFNLPIHFLIVNTKSITKDNILDYSYEVRESWEFPKIIKEEDSYEDGVLIVYNIYNNVANDIVGIDYKDNLNGTYLLLDSTLTNNNENIHNKIKVCSTILAEHYKDQQWSFYYLVLGIIGFVVLLMLISFFFRNAKVSSTNYKRKRTRFITAEENSSAERESYDSTFGGGRFGGGGATGNW